MDLDFIFRIFKYLEIYYMRNLISIKNTFAKNWTEASEKTSCGFPCVRSIRKFIQTLNVLLINTTQTKINGIEPLIVGIISGIFA